MFSYQMKTMFTFFFFVFCLAMHLFFQHDVFPFQFWFLLYFDNYRILKSKYTVWSSKIDHRPRNMLLIKNPQFLPNFYDTLSKCPTHELVILAKCHKNWVKIVDFFLIAYFWAGGQFCLTIL